MLAKKLEPVVLENVRRLLWDKGFASELLFEVNKVHTKNAQSNELEKSKARLYGINSQLEALAERLSQIPKNVSATPIFKQMERLETHKNDLDKQIEGLEQSGHSGEKPAELATYEAFTKYLRSIMIEPSDPDLKSKIIAKLIHRIEVTKGGVKIHYYVGEEHLRRNLMDLKAPIGGSAFLKCLGSNSLTNGAGDWT